MGVRIFILAGLLAVFSVPSTARIGAGTITVDDASTLWDGVWEVSAGIDAGGGYRLEGANIDLLRVPTELRYGLRDRFELGLVVPFSFQRSDAVRFDGSGLSDVRGAVKYQMSRDEGSSPASATELMFGWGAGEAVSSKAFSVGLNYSLSKTFGNENSFGHLNLGYMFYTENREDVFSWGAAYERLFGETWRGSIGVNAGSELISGVDNDIIVEAGFGKEINPSMDFLFSAGVGVSSRAPDWQMRMLLRKEFGSRAGEATEFRHFQWSEPAPPGVAEIVHQGEAAMRTGDYPSAIAFYEDALEKDPTLVAGWNNLGIAYYRAGESGKALKAYEKALTLAPNNADIYYNMGLVHFRLGDNFAARRAFARAVELDPAHKDARQSLNAMGGYGL